MNKNAKLTESSEHRPNWNTVMSEEEQCARKERRVPNVGTKEVSIARIVPECGVNKKVKEDRSGQSKRGREDECEANVADNERSMEVQEPPEDRWFCPTCSDTPCEFIQGQEELEACVSVMSPDLSNKQKRYNLYHRMTCRRHGLLGKRNRRALPPCFEQGMKDLHPSERYTGYKSADDSGPDDGSTPT